MYKFILVGFLLPFVALGFRMCYMIYKICTTKLPRLMTSETRLRTIICIGSGGHTTEMLRIVGKLNTSKYYPRFYIQADNDSNSQAKILNLESKNKAEVDYFVCGIPRSRDVNQSYFSSVITTVNATVRTIPLIFSIDPQVILCNGPGTCVPIVIIAFFMRSLFLLDCRVVFVESICRVKTLSLTGKILQFFADAFIVQWPDLLQASLRAKYLGRLT